MHTRHIVVCMIRSVLSAIIGKSQTKGKREEKNRAHRFGKATEEIWREKPQIIRDVYEMSTSLEGRKKTRKEWIRRTPDS